MIREEQINKEAYRQEKLVDMDVESFIAGATWADANPKSPWISVEEDLPCNHEELIDRKIPTYTLYVVVRLKDGTADSSRMIKIQDGNWVWPFKVSHWFPIPELPKE